MPLLFDIKRYAINDGPGIRTTLFFSGCPLRCVWCHNPESWLPRPRLTYKKSRCIGCRSCVEACRRGALRLSENGIDLEESLCRLSAVAASHKAPPCQAPCTEACPATALEMCGREWSVGELMDEVEKERDVMEDSGGGVTLCGGEPLMQDEAALEVLRELGRRHLHRAVDTTLYAPPQLVRRVAGNCELMLIDIKLMDSQKHKLYTGVSNELIMSNIELVYSLGVPFFIRIPLIEGINTDEQNIEATAQFLANIKQKYGQPDAHDNDSQRHGLLGVNLLPYHNVGSDKHRRLWSAFNPQGIPMTVPSENVQQRCIELFAAKKITATIGG